MSRNVSRVARRRAILDDQLNGGCPLSGAFVVDVCATCYRGGMQEGVLRAWPGH